jgi:hypothetical protein
LKAVEVSHCFLSRFIIKDATPRSEAAVPQVLSFLLVCETATFGMDAVVFLNGHGELAAGNQEREMYLSLLKSYLVLFQSFVP